MNDDASLLRSYADHGSEAAFAELVRRHLDLVYGTALRRTGGDVHSAADVAQQVFTKLAQNARQLSRHTVLGAWLHTATRNTALNLMISDQRRKTREAAALALHANEESIPDWERLRPMLDEAIDELPEADRAAVVLRFLEHRAFAEIGAALRLSEDTARKRVDRALDKLRAALGRRGVNSTSAALVVAFANQVGATAPVGLAASISGAALESVVAVGGIAATGAGIFMSKATSVIVVVAFVAISSTFYQWNHAQRAETELAALTVDRDGLRAQLAAEQQRSARAGQDIAALQGEIASLKAKQVVVPPVSRPTSPVAVPLISAETEAAMAQMRRKSMDKAIGNNLRALAAARDRFQLQNGRAPAALEELVGEGKLIRVFVPVHGESYPPTLLLPGAPLVVTDADGVSVTFDPSAPPPPRELTPSELTPAQRRAAELFNNIGGAMGKAAEAYRAANGGSSPSSFKDLIPFFATPQEGADFVEAMEAMAQLVPRAK